MDANQNQRKVAQPIQEWNCYSIQNNHRGLFDCIKPTFILLINNAIQCTHVHKFKRLFIQWPYISSHFWQGALDDRVFFVWIFWLIHNSSLRFPKFVSLNKKKLSLGKKDIFQIKVDINKIWKKFPSKMMVVRSVRQFWLVFAMNIFFFSVIEKSVRPKYQ